VKLIGNSYALDMGKIAADTQKHRKSTLIQDKLVNNTLHASEAIDSNETPLKFAWGRNLAIGLGLAFLISLPIIPI
jgi:hypothetical protein